MNDYDVIVIGAGISSLIAANVLQSEGKKVLVLEKNSSFSKESNNVIKGRFTFNSTISEVGFSNGDNDIVDNILKNIGIKNLEYIKLKDVFRLIAKDDTGHRLDYEMPFGIKRFVEKMEEIVPESTDSMNRYFELAEECSNGLKYVLSCGGRTNDEIMKTKYENFMKVSTYSHSEILDMLGVPLRAQEILNAFWLNFGSSETEISFVHYAAFVYEYIRNGISVLKEGNYGLLHLLTDKFIENGGTIRYSSTVNKIITNDKKVNGVSLLDGTNIYSNHVIYNGSEHNLYGKLIDQKEVPSSAIRKCNMKELGLRRFTVQLGLNRTNEELGINNPRYYLFDSLDSDLEYTKMNNLRIDSGLCRCFNAMYDEASPEGTTLLELNTYFSGSVFEEEVNEKNYDQIKEKVAEDLIKLFEVKLKTKIKPYIEEINIITPVDYYMMNGNYSDGYKLTGYENLLYRYYDMVNAKSIQGLYICGPFACFGGTTDGLYMSGQVAAFFTLKEMVGE